MGRQQTRGRESLGKPRETGLTRALPLPIVREGNAHTSLLTPGEEGDTLEQRCLPQARWGPPRSARAQLSQECENYLVPPPPPRSDCGT